MAGFSPDKGNMNKTAWILDEMNVDERRRKIRRKSEADSSPAMRTSFLVNTMVLLFLTDPVEKLNDNRTDARRPSNSHQFCRVLPVNEEMEGRVYRKFLGAGYALLNRTAESTWNKRARRNTRSLCLHQRCRKALLG